MKPLARVADRPRLELRERGRGRQRERDGEDAGHATSGAIAHESLNAPEKGNSGPLEEAISEYHTEEWEIRTAR